MGVPERVGLDFRKVTSECKLEREVGIHQRKKEPGACWEEPCSLGKGRKCEWPLDMRGKERNSQVGGKAGARQQNLGAL